MVFLSDKAILKIGGLDRINFYYIYEKSSNRNTLGSCELPENCGVPLVMIPQLIIAGVFYRLLDICGKKIKVED